MTAKPSIRPDPENDGALSQKNQSRLHEGAVLSCHNVISARAAIMHARLVIANRAYRSCAYAIVAARYIFITREPITERLE